MFRARLAVLAVAGTLLALAGCNKAAKVEGTVTYKGAPVDGASVTLFDNNGAIVANGTTDASGKFVLLNPQFKDDIPAGEYKAVVTKSGMSSTSGEPAIGPDGKMSPEAMKMMKSTMAKKGYTPKTNLLPEKFSTRESTTLTVKVPPAGPVTLNLDS